MACLGDRPDGFDQRRVTVEHGFHFFDLCDVGEDAVRARHRRRVPEKVYKLNECQGGELRCQVTV